MTDSPADVVSSWIGPLIGIGFGIATIKLLSNLNTTSQEQTEIQTILSRAKKTQQGFFLLRCFNKNLVKAKRVLNRSGFKILGEYPSAPGISYLKFKEKE